MFRNTVTVPTGRLKVILATRARGPALSQGLTGAWIILGRAQLLIIDIKLKDSRFVGVEQ